MPYQTIHFVCLIACASYLSPIDDGCVVVAIVAPSDVSLASFLPAVVSFFFSFHFALSLSYADSVLYGVRVRVVCMISLYRCHPGLIHTVELYVLGFLLGL